jgi:two-component system sensor histidine kinase VicK
MTFSSDPAGGEIEEKTEIIYGEENIINYALERYSVLRRSLDLCLDSTGPSMISIDYMAKTYKGLKERGVQLRFITDITKDNIDYCKEFMKICELRHLNDVKCNFGLGDKVHYIASARVRESAPPPLLISSSVRAFVEQQGYFFEMLWSDSRQTENRGN